MSVIKLLKSYEVRDGNIVKPIEKYRTLAYLIRPALGVQSGPYCAISGSGIAHIQTTGTWCEAVEITEQWLDIFGFKHYKEEKFREEYYYKENCFHPVGGGTCTFRLFRHKNGFTIESSDFGPNLQYVHKLQNLYFDLTETELPLDLIKLTKYFGANHEQKNK